MIAVVRHPDVTTYVDERLFEALLACTLNWVPSWQDDLFGLTAIHFQRGCRGQPDVVGYHGDDLAAGIEVKIHSQHNWQEGPRRWQLDAYAAAAPDVPLFLILPGCRVAPFMSKLQRDKVSSRSRWQPVTLSQLHDTLARRTGLTPAADGDPAAQLMLALARLAP
jgi:hypothetical protein